VVQGSWDFLTGSWLRTATSVISTALNNILVESFSEIKTELVFVFWLSPWSKGAVTNDITD